jgi:inorganic pyrophosphatase
MMIAHPWHGVPVGEGSPDSVNAIIEIPALSRVKTELDKITGLLRVDRILHSSVVYPANYGFIPSTLAEDGDPLDILVLCQLSVPPLALVRVRPIGVMPMEDGGVLDHKIVAVAITDPEYGIYNDINELPPFKLLMINQFFHDYRILERKQVKTSKPQGAGQARDIIRKAISAYDAGFKPKRKPRQSTN